MAPSVNIAFPSFDQVAASIYGIVEAYKYARNPRYSPTSPPGWQYEEQLSGYIDALDPCSATIWGLVYRNPLTSQYLVAVRGTYFWEDVYNDLNVTQTQISGNPDAAVGTGFYNAYTASWAGTSSLKESFASFISRIDSSINHN